MITASSSRAPRPRAKARARRVLGGLVVLAAAVVSYVGYSELVADELGEVCLTSVDCRYFGVADRLCDPQGWGYCTRRCAQDADCPRGWQCNKHHPSELGPLCQKPK